MNREGGGQGNPQAQAACASCKHQRKRCDSTCELAPYFPASKYREFQNAHKLFGVSNIQKILNAVEPEQRTAAAESLLLEGTFRREDPVYGSFGIVCKLESELDLCKQELYAVNRQLAYFKEREQLLQQKEQLEGILEVESSLSLNKIPRGFYFGDDGKNLDHAYHYQSTLEVGEDVKPFDIQSDEMIDFSSQPKAHVDGSQTIGLSQDQGEGYLETKKET
ncbi:LOB domain-containing protein 22 [Vitis vinifera]|uniref:LOB domain-containing protein 22 n=1 Tax=Vitis vinifera TaxID=29760 RepID=A0A438J8P0_VITVI|nr:LOB domain-containing protein 22 [Vitis vinifera]